MRGKSERLLHMNDACQQASKPAVRPSLSILRQEPEICDNLLSVQEGREFGPCYYYPESNNGRHILYWQNNRKEMSCR
jgi:hypothetical protein